jgi:tRNA pseudouridine13 synthase
MFRECRTAEADIGMRFYLTDVDGSGGKLKVSAEDFVVREISSYPEPSDDGKYCIADVTVTNWETNRLVRVLSRTIGMSRERIGFAGTKDKRAVTTRLMSFECTPEQLASVDLKDVVISNVYRARRGIRIGDLRGNSFVIRVRDCDPVPGNIKRIEDIVSKTGGFPNYFGVQRFGSARPVTHIVGERIVRGDLEGAVRAYLSQPSEFESEDTSEARRMLAEDPERAIPMMPKTMSFEKVIAEHLIKRPGDHAGAISALPPNLQMMFVHAYQSYLFNLVLSERMRLGLPLNEPVAGDVVIPVDADGNPVHERPTVVTDRNIDLVARQVVRGRAYVTATLYGSESTIQDGLMGGIESSVIENEGITNADFVVTGLPHCSSKGSRREMICPVDGLSYTVGDNDYEMRFSLTKGNYATCLMREFMKSDMSQY